MWLVATIVALAITGLVSWVFYDLLIRRVYKNRPTDWEKVGKPLGMFHAPAGSSIFTGSFSRYRLMMFLFLNTPKWIAQDGFSRKLLFWYRVCSGVYLIGILGLLVFFVIALLGS